MLSLAYSLSAQTVSFSQYPIPTSNLVTGQIAAGPDGALWFTEITSNQIAGNKIGRITTAGTVIDFSLPSITSIEGICAGPDGALWFTEPFSNKIGRITTQGVITEYPAGAIYPYLITSGPDGALWYTDFYATAIGRITTTGETDTFTIPRGGGAPSAITAGPDGALWLTQGVRFAISGPPSGANQIGRINTTGGISEFPTSASGGCYPCNTAAGITAGPDGALWFAEISGQKIGRMTTTGAFTEFSIPTPNSGAFNIAQGPDGALWFTETTADKIGRITMDGVITEYLVPAAGASPAGIAPGPDGALWFTEGTGKIGRAAIPSGGIVGPSALSVVPANGSGIQQTFTFQFFHPAGYQALNIIDILINDFLDGRSACYLAYVVPSATLLLVNDQGKAEGPYAGSLVLGNTGTIQNSQCALGLTSAVGSGNSLTLTLNILFQPGFGGNKIAYLAARDQAAGSSGWQALGVWQVPPAPSGQITVTSLTPPRTAAPARTGQTLTAVLTDTKGTGDFGVINLLANTFIDGRQACYVAYVASANTLYLVDDAGDAGGPFAGSIVLNGNAGAIQNSQCSINGVGASAVSNGNTLTLTLNITFKPPFAGNRIVWVAGRDMAGGNNTDWNAMGTSTVQ
jgi:virginiamycin B lyase